MTRRGMSAHVLFLALAGMLLFLLTGCERNALRASDPDGDADDVPSTDGDTEGEGDAEDSAEDGDAEDSAEDGDAEQAESHEPEAPLVKWITPSNSRISVGADGRVLMLSRAGLLVLDHAGTPESPEDDLLRTHHEETFPNWPTGEPVAMCEDEAGAIWFSTARTLAVLYPGATQEKDRLLVPDLAALPDSRRIITLFCESDRPGVWVATSSGLLAVLPDPENAADIESWTIVDYSDGHVAMSSYPNAVTRDMMGRFWLAVFVEDGFSLFAVETKDPATPEDDVVYDIPFGVDAPTPLALVADGEFGLWLLDDRQVWHLDYAYRLSPTAGHVWAPLPTPGDAPIEVILPLESGHVLLVEEGSRALYRGRLRGEPDIETLPSLGLNAENPLTGAAYEPGVGLWYSSRVSAGFVHWEPGEDWTPLPLASLGPVPGNELSGFLADESGVWLGGPNGVVRVSYGADTGRGDYHFTGYAITQPDSPAPFGVTALAPLGSGLVAGGAYLAYLDPQAGVTVWAERNQPKSINLLHTAPGDTLLVSTILRSLVTIVGLSTFDYRGTPTNPKDDRNQAIDTAYFGMGSGLPVQAMASLGGCRYVIGTIADLHYWDCADTPMDPGDDRVYPNQLVAGEEPHRDQSIRAVVPAPEGGAWFISKDGLGYLDFGDPADSEDNQIVPYSIPSIANHLSVDSEGRLYYFMRDGLMIHNPKGTPADPTDDEVALIPMRTDRRALVEPDAFGKLWFSLGDGTGIYHGVFDALDFRPLAEFLAD